MDRCPCARKFPDGQERVEDGTFVYFPHKVGRSILVCGRRSAQFPYHILVGPEWPCMFVTYGLIIVPTVFFLMNVAYLLHPVVVVLGTLTASATIWFYSATACSDPGIVYTYSEVVNSSSQASPSSSTQRARSPNEGNIEDGVGGGGSFHGSDAGVGSVSSGSSGRRKNTDTDRTGSTQTPGSSGSGCGSGTAPEPEATPPVALIQCGQCSIDRPVTAAHCYECGVCVDELDHHCPWTGKCIAKKNLKNFRFFLGTLCFHIIFVISASAYALVKRFDIFSGAQ